jgi:hypothetical protein
MIRETKMYKILSFVHLILTTSIFLGTITLFSFGVLFLPTLTSVFYLGKQLMYGNYNVYDGIFKILFKKLKEYMHMLRFFPVYIIFIMQSVGIYVAGLQGLLFLQIVLLSMGAFVLVYIFYIIGYEIFIGNGYNSFQVVIAMFYKVNYFISLWILAILGMLFFQLSAVKYLFIVGSIIALAIEVIIFLTLIPFKEVSGMSDEDNENTMPKWYKKFNS